MRVISPLSYQSELEKIVPPVLGVVYTRECEKVKEKKDREKGEQNVHKSRAQERRAEKGAHCPCCENCSCLRLKNTTIPLLCWISTGHSIIEKMLNTKINVINYSVGKMKLKFGRWVGEA